MGELLKEMGQRMLDRRKQLRLTQETLAKMAHVTPQTISTAELGTPLRSLHPVSSRPDVLKTHHFYEVFLTFWVP